MSDEVRRTFVELLYPGIFAVEHDVHEVTLRDPAAIAKKYPECFAFQFFDTINKPVVIGGETKKVSSSRLNRSPKYYPGGIAMTVDDVKALVPNSRILVTNMEGNQWERVVKTRCGNFQPFGATDELLSEPRRRATRRLPREER